MITVDYIRPIPPRQQGVALVMAMLFLLILTLIGVSALSSTSMQEKMAGNSQNKHAAFQAAESALIEGESLVQGWTSSTEPDFTQNVGGFYEPAPGSGYPRWKLMDWLDFAPTSATAVLTYTSKTIQGIKTQPSYIIELLSTISGSTGGTGSLVTGFAPPPATSGSTKMYRVTARGTGGTDDAMAIVQSVYRK